MNQRLFTDRPTSNPDTKPSGRTRLADNALTLDAPEGGRSMTERAIRARDNLHPATDRWLL